MFRASRFFLQAISALVVGFGPGGAQAQNVVLVGAAFVDLDCWREVMAKVTPHQMELPNPGTDRWLKETFPKESSVALSSTELPRWRVNSPFAEQMGLLDLVNQKALGGLDLRPCFVKAEQLPIYAKHQALTGSLTAVEKRVKDLEEKYTAAKDVELDLVERLTRMKESMTALEEELARLRATPTKAQTVKTK